MPTLECHQEYEDYQDWRKDHLGRTCPPSGTYTCPVSEGNITAGPSHPGHNLCHLLPSARPNYQTLKKKFFSTDHYSHELLNQSTTCDNLLYHCTFVNNPVFIFHIFNALSSIHLPNVHIALVLNTCLFIVLVLVDNAKPESNSLYAAHILEE